MVLTSFYEIKDQVIQENGILTVLTFTEAHEVYDGHFPGNPITPGVCLLQTAKQLLEQAWDKSLRVDTVLNVKFLKLVIPSDTKEMHYKMQILPAKEEGKETISLVIKDKEEEVYTKAKIIYTIL